MCIAEFHALGSHLLLPLLALVMSAPGRSSKMPQTSWQSLHLGVQVSVVVGYGEGVVTDSHTTRQPQQLLLVVLLLDLPHRSYMIQSLFFLISV